MMRLVMASQRYVNKDAGILVVRSALGLLLFYHGLDKLINFSYIVEFFPDPLGVGESASLGLTIFAEMIGGLALTLGFLSRFFLIPIFITMAVAFFIVHAQDAFQLKELAFAYWLLSIALLISGPGNYSVDRVIIKQNAREHAYGHTHRHSTAKR